MQVTINNLLRAMGLNLHSVYAWEGINNNVAVFKLWRKDILQTTGGVIRIVCLRPTRPSGSRGSRWESRRNAVQQVASGEWQGFATIGDEGPGTQRSYVGFDASGAHRILSVEKQLDGSYVATLAEDLSPIAEVRAPNRIDKSHCEVWLEDSWHLLAVTTLLENGNYRDLIKRCPVCHGPVRLEHRSAPDKMKVMKDRFEHQPAHRGCRLASTFDGIETPSPHAVSQPLATLELAPTISDYIDEASAETMIGSVPDKTVREQLLLARVGQGRFRSALLKLWGKCSVTGCENSGLLVASHIVPWRDSTNAQRLDPFNGLLLTPSLDKLFDRHLISFDNDGRIHVSRHLNSQDLEALGVSDAMRLRTLHSRQRLYMERHFQIYTMLAARPLRARGRAKIRH